jgi:hypothetical protein
MRVTGITQITPTRDPNRLQGRGDPTENRKTILRELGEVRGLRLHATPNAYMGPHGKKTNHITRVTRITQITPTGDPKRLEGTPRKKDKP